MTTADIVFSVVVVTFWLYIAIDVYVSYKQRQILKWYRERASRLTVACWELRNHATTCRDVVGLDRDGDYSRRLSKMISDADAAIQDK